MNVQAPIVLTFAQLDDLAFAAERGRLDGVALDSIKLSVCDLGPLLEAHHLAADGRLPLSQYSSWLGFNDTLEFFRAIVNGHRQWLCPRSRSSGFLRAERQPPTDETTWTAFGLAAQKAAVTAGLPKKTAAQLVGAVVEMQNNIYDHSEAPQTGLLAFHAVHGVFEFVVADYGIGVLESLRSGQAHANTTDYGTALQLTLTEGCSRHGDGIGRGLGFRPLFVGLSNLRAELRFRSGDHALTIDGSRPAVVMARLAQKPHIRGLYISVRCALGSGTSIS